MCLVIHLVLSREGLIDVSMNLTITETYSSTIAERFLFAPASPRPDDKGNAEGSDCALSSTEWGNFSQQFLNAGVDLSGTNWRRQGECRWAIGCVLCL